jgi:hypothetical protein
VIPKEFQATLSDARSQVDCFINLSFLATILGFLEVASVAWSLYSLIPQILAESAQHGLLAAARNLVCSVRLDSAIWALCAFGFAWLAYRLALDRGIALGEQVKAAFDLYLGALLTQLGYTLPKTMGEQKMLWRNLRRSYSYFEPVPQDHRVNH